MKTLPFTLRELPGGRSLAIQGLLFACLLALFVYIGPFGTFDTIELAGRAGYWTLTMGANWLVCSCVMAIVIRLTTAASLPTRLMAIAAAAVVAAIPGTGVVYTAETLFRPGYLDQAALPDIYFGVAVVMLAISILVIFVTVGDPANKGTWDREHAAEENGASATIRFLDRLPPKLGRDLIYLRMADHYVEAFTTAGSTLVLMRFADAVAELEGVGGLRIHRSYWVAKRHVIGTDRQNGRTILRLTGGHEAPVSRGYLSAVRQAGLA